MFALATMTIGISDGVRNNSSTDQRMMDAMAQERIKSLVQARQTAVDVADLIRAESSG